MTATPDPDVSRLQARDEAEWETTVRAYWPRVFRYVGGSIADRASCEDLTQSVFRGAVEGIGRFDRRYNFEQYLFGIARNRVIDFLRRKRPVPASAVGDPGASSTFDPMAGSPAPGETPSRILAGRETTARRREALERALRGFVREEWERGEFVRLAVVEALLVGGERNKDVWRRFGLRDEVAVAGIKFRAIRKIREGLREADPSRTLFPELSREGE